MQDERMTIANAEMKCRELKTKLDALNVFEQVGFFMRFYAMTRCVFYGSGGNERIRRAFTVNVVLTADWVVLDL